MFKEAMLILAFIVNVVVPFKQHLEHLLFFHLVITIIIVVKPTIIMLLIVVIKQS
jgi:hypothetical protein